MIEEYSKKEIIGYLLLALENTRMEVKETKILISSMDVAMETWTEDYAEQVYDKFYGIKGV